MDVYLILIFLGSGLPAARAGSPGQGIRKETPNHIVWELADGRQVGLTKGPRRVVGLLTSLLELWYEAGGRAVARCNGRLNVPESALNLPCVGTVNNPNAAFSQAPDDYTVEDLGGYGRFAFPLTPAFGGYPILNMAIASIRISPLKRPPNTA